MHDFTSCNKEAHFASITVPNKSIYISQNYSEFCFSIVLRKVFALEEGVSGEWGSRELCMGDSSVCTGSLVGKARKRHILAFGEDEEGELYILATSYASTTTAEGVVYRIVDPARLVELYNRI